MKKETNWITIPEEALHTPAASSGKPKKNSAPVTNKLFWGAGFIIVVIAVFAMIAPTQFNSLLRGSLFDTTGLPEDEVGKPMGLTNLVPSESEEEAEIDSESSSEGDEVSQPEPVVQPEEDAVTISVEPISGPEDVEVKPVAEEETPGDELIQELKEQIEQLQAQREQQDKDLQDLAKIVQSQSVYPSAPTSITSTTAIGQPSAQSGFRQNPYTVTITPEEMLRQNMARGGQYAQQPPAYTQPIAYQQTYQESIPQTDRTPDTGPSEVMIIAFLLTFVSLIGWKLIRLSIA